MPTRIRGINSTDVPARLGRYLRELAGVAAGSQAADIGDLAENLGSYLRTCAWRLPDDVRLAALASSGILTGTAKTSNFGDRVRWLSDQVGRTERTTLRRIYEAELLLAEEIAVELASRRGQDASSPMGWYLDELRTVLRLDTPTPESHEYRRIVATKPGLTHVRALMDVPTNPGEPKAELSAEVLYGGRLVRQPDAEGTRFDFLIELPEPLGPGDQHEYSLILRMAPGTHMRPHYIFSPEHRCNAFDLTVRFDPDHLPIWVREVRGETVRTFENPPAEADYIQLDRAGEAHARFEDPVLYLGYGLQWNPQSPGPRWESHG